MSREQPFTSQITTVFHRTRGAERMERTAAAEAVKRDPLLSFDPWSIPQDVGGAHDIPHDWQSLPIEAKRALMTKMRLPAGSRGEECHSHITTIDHCLSQRVGTRWNAAMGWR